MLFQFFGSKSQNSKKTIILGSKNSGARVNFRFLLPPPPRAPHNGYSTRGGGGGEWSKSKNSWGDNVVLQNDDFLQGAKGVREYPPKMGVYGVHGCT